jgi:hypothetical protein
MIDPTRHNPAQAAAATPRPVLRMVENDRMAGSVPVWDSRAAAAQTATAEPQQFSDILSSYTTQDTPADTTVVQETDSEPFGFFDLLDMVNPLQHIPIVSSLYRSITGDEIKPVARIIGGTVFGGPAGGAMSLANVIIEEETGKDITGNVIAMVQGDDVQWQDHTPDQPEQQLNNALAMASTGADENTARDSLPPAALAYADMGASHTRKNTYAAKTEDDRMAGERPRFRSADDDNNGYYYTHNIRNKLAESLPPREPVTKLDIARLPVIHFES